MAKYLQSDNLIFVNKESWQKLWLVFEQGIKTVENQKSFLRISGQVGLSRNKSFGLVFWKIGLVIEKSIHQIEIYFIRIAQETFEL